MREKRWLAHYDEGVPQTLVPYPLHTLLHYVAETAQQRPDHPALLFQGRSVTYAALAGLSNACAAALVAMGVKPDDRVALLLPNCPQFLIAELVPGRPGRLSCRLIPWPVPTNCAPF
jgi:long-chain acyl-CoA synthetase